MKIQVFLFIAALLLFSAFVQETEGLGVLPPGNGMLKRKVCAHIMKKKNLSKSAIDHCRLTFFQISKKNSTDAKCCSLSLQSSHYAVFYLEF